MTWTDRIVTALTFSGLLVVEDKKSYLIGLVSGIIFGITIHLFIKGVRKWLTRKKKN